MKQTLQAFIKLIPSDKLVVLHGNTETLRNGDVHFPFRQSSDFLYLTDLDAPDLIVTILNNEMIIWRESITDREILWWHNKLSDDEIRNISWISDIRNKDFFNAYYTDHRECVLYPDIITEYIHSLRIIKNPSEIEKIKIANRVTKKAFNHIASIIKSGMYEYEVEAEIVRIFRSHHMTEAYPTIVASWPNSCILHYTKHSRQLLDWDLVLIDAWSEYGWYASDVTRTFCVWGTFSQRQQEVYDAVVRTKKIAENTIKPGILFSEYENIVRSHTNLELIALGLIPENSSDAEIQKLSRKYYPHRTSHFLGLDVHDVGPRDIILEKGMVLTIEPGIYIEEENIGIRLEDDYLITDNSCECLG
jgi:Xaa-Pro aminopeptidase